MKASEMVKKLNKIIAEKGDLYVEAYDSQGVDVRVTNVEVYPGVITPFIMID